MAIRDCVVDLARSRKEELEGKDGGTPAEVEAAGEGTVP